MTLITIPLFFKPSECPPPNNDLILATDGHTMGLARYVGDEEYEDTQGRPWLVEGWAELPNESRVMDEIEKLRRATIHLPRQPKETPEITDYANHVEA